MSSGRRLKVKSTQVLLTFRAERLEDFMQEAESIAQGLDIEFLWTCSPEDDFRAETFGREVFGESCRPQDEAGLLLALQSAPIYFQRRGKGLFRAAPEEQVKTALAAVERRQRLAQAQAALTEALVSGSCPQVYGQDPIAFLVSPDRQSIEVKALEAAAFQLGCSTERRRAGGSAYPRGGGGNGRGGLARAHRDVSNGRTLCRCAAAARDDIHVDRHAGGG
jgi:exoribonuclease-2